MKRATKTVWHKVPEGGRGLHDRPRAPAAHLDPEGLDLDRDVVEPLLARARGGAGQVQGHRDLVPCVFIIIDLCREISLFKPAAWFKICIRFRFRTPAVVFSFKCIFLISHRILLGG